MSERFPTLWPFFSMETTYFSGKMFVGFLAFQVVIISRI